MTAPAEYTDWQAGRLAALSAEDGWLNLTDRVDIGPGPQTVGTAADNDIVLRGGPDHLGVLLPGFRFQAVGGDVRDFVAAAGGNPVLKAEPFLLEIHSVDGQPALRVRDLRRPRGVNLSYYPYQPAWRIRARWEALAVPVNQSIDQKGAAPTQVFLTHKAHFNWAGQPVTLLATHWKAGLPMFVVRDQTSGRETYAASRFLIGEDVSDTEVTLDFNKAHNPPCAFTDFAICPLPPRENILTFAVLAGELRLD